MSQRAGVFSPRLSEMNSSASLGRLRSTKQIKSMRVLNLVEKNAQSSSSIGIRTSTKYEGGNDSS